MRWNKNDGEPGDDFTVPLRELAKLYLIFYAFVFCAFLKVL